MLNSNFELKDTGVSNALSIGDLPRHRWYFIKEGFSPKLVEQAIAIEGVEKGDLLIDPFSGSGTSPLTSVTAGLKTISFEVNPFLHFLSATKLVQADTKAFTTSAAIIVKGFEKPISSPLEGISTFTHGNRWKRWLFSRNVLRSYEGASKMLNRVPESQRGLMKLILLGSTLDCCNAEPDGKCLRYKTNWRDNPYNRDDLIAAFRQRLKIITEDLEKAPLTGINAQIVKGDARKLLKKQKYEKFRLCVTSPPYLNSFDYSDVYRPELFLGSFVKSNDSLMKIRLNTVRSHVQANWKRPQKNDFGSIYKNCIKKFHDVRNELWDKRIPLMVQGYFEDMETILTDLKAKALPNASAWFIVSTSAYEGIEIPVDLILAEIGQRCGWFLREVGVLRYLRSSGQQMDCLATKDRISIPLRESVVIFDASKKPSQKRTAQHSS